MTVELDDPKPRLGFKTVGTVELSSTGRSVALDITECSRCTYGCKNRKYISREHLAQLLHGHRKTTSIYILVPESELDVDDSGK